MNNWRFWLYLELGLLVGFLLYPLVGVDGVVLQWTGRPLGSDLTILFVFAVLALGLNVVLGYTGLLHLGIAAFFGIGAYITAILLVRDYPFQVGFVAALAAAVVGAALAGLLVGAPTLRLRGDYLALVTLGFGEVVRVTLRNFENLTGGMSPLTNVPQPFQQANPAVAWIPMYYIALVALLLSYLLLRRLELSRVGRAWNAIREDELAAACMGLRAARIKLSAFALGAGLAGLAGCLYAVSIRTTSDPEAYGFNRSVLVLCCVILGGLGSLRGAILGVFLLIGFDNILTPMLDSAIQRSGFVESVQASMTDPEARELARRLLTFTNWKLAIFGIVLVLMMRFRPEGLLPSARVQLELHSEEETKAQDHPSRIIRPADLRERR